MNFGSDRVPSHALSIVSFPPPYPPSPLRGVPSHVGVEGNEQVDLRANKGAKIAKNKVALLWKFWADLGLQEMPDTYDTDCNDSGGSCLSSEEEQRHGLSVGK